MYIIQGFGILIIYSDIAGESDLYSATFLYGQVALQKKGRISHHFTDMLLLLLILHIIVNDILVSHLSD